MTRSCRYAYCRALVGCVFEIAMQAPTPRCTSLDPCSTTLRLRQPRYQRHKWRHALICANVEVGFEMYYYWKARFDEPLSKTTATRHEARPYLRQQTEHTRVSTTCRAQAQALAAFSSTAFKRRCDAAAASSDSTSPGRCAARRRCWCAGAAAVWVRRARQASPGRTVRRPETVRRPGRRRWRAGLQGRRGGARESSAGCVCRGDARA